MRKIAFEAEEEGLLEGDFEYGNEDEAPKRFRGLTFGIMGCLGVQ